MLLKLIPAVILVAAFAGNARAQSVTVTSSSPANNFASYRPGDRVHVQAGITATDPSDQNEAEPLIISSSDGEFSATVTVAEGPIDQEFVAHGTGTLSAAIPNGDADETGSVTVTIGRLDCAQLKQEIQTDINQQLSLTQTLIQLQSDAQALQSKKSSLQLAKVGCHFNCDQIDKQLADINQQIADNTAQQNIDNALLAQLDRDIPRLTDLYHQNCQ